MTQYLARELEYLIRRAPEQWHLFQPNWPSDPGYRAPDAPIGRPGTAHRLHKRWSFVDVELVEGSFVLSRPVLLSGPLVFDGDEHPRTVVADRRMGRRRGRSHSFLQHWHDREVELADGALLTWVLIDDPQHRGPHAECFRLDGEGLHPVEARRLLCGHPDAELVAVDTHVGRGAFH